MAEKSALVFLSLFLNFLYICTSKEAEVFCAEGAKCVLPCNFQADTYISIHWRKTEEREERRVHSYHDKKDRLEHQHQDFRNRTSLFNEEISKGNGSLSLSDVKLQDSGTYMCLTGTGDGSISSVKVTVYERSFDIDVVRHDSEMVCSSEAIFPEPAVTWFTGDLPTETEGYTTVHHREDQRYDVHSSITLPSTFTECSCHIRTAHYWRSTEITEEHLHGVFNSDAVLRCPVSKAPTKSIIWKFNHTERIVSLIGSERILNESWRSFVKELRGSNDLVLMDLTLDQEGLYSCHVSTDHRTFVSVINLKIQLMQVYLQIYEDAAANLDWIFVWIFSAFLIFGISFYFKDD